MKMMNPSPLPGCSEVAALVILILAAVWMAAQSRQLNRIEKAANQLSRIEKTVNQINADWNQ